MLSKDKYYEKFNRLQQKTIEATNELINWITFGKNEKQIANKYQEILANKGLIDHWYPILIYSGDLTGKPITRRIHLPSKDLIVKEGDIVFIDSTPMDKTVWANWCETMVIGKNDFLKQLIDDTRGIVEKTANFGRRRAKTVGDIYDFALELINKKGLTMLDPYKDVGHSIFQVPEGQTVEKTPTEDRLLLNEQFSARKLKGIISIEPQLGRVKPNDGKMYGAKLQEIIIYR